MKINLSQNMTKHMSQFKSHEQPIDIPVQSYKQRSGIHLNLTLHTDVDSERHKVEASVAKMNDFIEPVVADVKFVFHEDLHEYYVTVVNPITDEVIREIPPKKMLDMYAAMTEYMGLLVDKKI